MNTIAFKIGTCEALVQLIEGSVKRSDNEFLINRILPLTKQLKEVHEEMINEIQKPVNELCED